MAIAQPAYGGTALRSGSSGPDVALVQTWLNGVRGEWPGIPAVSVDGKFGSNTAAAVRAFQIAAGLQSDGVVGQNTWAALGSAYADAHGAGEIFPGLSLREGHRGATVKSAQQNLQGIAPSLAADGRYGPATKKAVEAYQLVNGLANDGILGRRTWAKLYNA